MSPPSWVVDCSLVLAWALPDEASVQADRFFASLPPGVKLLVPALFWCETANALVVACRRNRLPQSDLVKLAGLLAELPLRTVAAGPDSCMALQELALRHQLSAYDAAYLELALGTGSGLATLDSRLREAAANAGVERL